MKKSLLTQQINENRDGINSLSAISTTISLCETVLPLEKDEAEKLQMAVQLLKQHLRREEEYLWLRREEETIQEDPAYSASAWTKKGGNR